MRVLILHASAGAGHRRAAEALGKAFAAESSAKAEVTIRDILDFTPPLFRRTYAQGYLDVVRRAPELWSYAYARSDQKSQEPLRKHVRALFNKINAPRFTDFVDELAPDAVVCTHFMPLERLSTRTRHGKFSTPLYCVVTDFAVHSLWMVDRVTAYYVANEESRRHLLRNGKSPEDVAVTGIPIDPVFAARKQAEAARTALGLEPGLPAVLILSGGFGVGPTVELIAAFKEATRPCQLLVVAGANEKLRKEAEAVAGTVGRPVKVFGFVNNMHELMDAADVVITKPGGLTSSEVLAKGKPMIIVDPIPGQEQRNCECLLEGGAALRLFDVHDAPYKVERLLSDPRRLEEMRRNAKSLGHPNAGRDIVADILRRGHSSS
jgi:processive 1,2-diacylglycerol beta-glucosyltransferase